jgi:two-component system, NarL family, response regulator NreC
MSKIKLAIAEDYKPFRQQIVEILNQEVDFEVILQADNGKELLESLETIQPDIVLMDIKMPVMDGIEATDRIRKAYPKTKIIAFSQYDNESNIVEMNIHGVKSFIGKNDEPKELFKAIRTVNGGAVYMTNRSAEIVQRYLSNISKLLNHSPSELCEQEKTFLKMIIEGLTSQQIGKKLAKSHRTVDDMRQKLYLKFNVKNKEQLIALASKWNLE